MKYIRDLLYFGYYQALSCIFPVVIFVTLAVSKIIVIPGLHRYDFILLICLMYASVASYICQAWNQFHLRMNNWPKYIWTIPLGVIIYLNFFTHHYILDLRWILTILLFIVFAQTYVQFTV